MMFTGDANPLTLTLTASLLQLNLAPLVLHLQ